MSTAVKGNVPKHMSFAWAKKRMKDAHAAGFYLEAMSIAESILSDRVGSYVQVAGSARPAGGPMLVTLVTSERFAANPELSARVDAWRTQRKLVISEFVKSPPGQAPATPIDVYLALAAATAAGGIELVRVVDNWHKREKRKSKTPR